MQVEAEGRQHHHISQHTSKYWELSTERLQEAHRRTYRGSGLGFVLLQEVAQLTYYCPEDTLRRTCEDF